jgi:hypothetical protein
MHCSGAEDLAIPDFDGTLAPVVADPTEKRLDASKWHVLASLSRTSDIVVTSISGRAIDDLRMRVCVPDIIYAGNRHLLEIRDDCIRTAVLFAAFRSNDSLVALSGSMTHKVEKDSESQAMKRADGPPDVCEVVQ